jgi:hypothetical protein
MKSSSVALGALLLLSAVAQAQSIPTTRHSWRRAGGLHVGYPVGVSIAMGTQRTVHYFAPDRSGNDRKIDFFVVGEPGIGASRVSAGWMYTGANAGGFGVRLSTMWQYYQERALAVGPEITMMKFLFLGARVGLFRRVVGSSQRTLLGVDLSLMY